MKDSEQTYGDFTLDTYQRKDGFWVCEWWKRSDPHGTSGKEVQWKRQDAIAEAKYRIDHLNEG